MKTESASVPTIGKMLYITLKDTLFKLINKNISTPIMSPFCTQLKYSSRCNMFLFLSIIAFRILLLSFPKLNSYHLTAPFFLGLYNSMLKIASKLESEAPKKTKMIVREMVANSIGMKRLLCVEMSILSTPFIYRQLLQPSLH